LSHLYLIRHAQASFLADDYDQLSPKGEEQSTILGNYLVQKKIQFDKIYVGPLKRQKQTYELVKKAYLNQGLDCPEAIEIEALKEYEGLHSMEIFEELLSQHHPSFRKWFAEMKTQPNHKTKMKMVVSYLDKWASNTLGFELPEGTQTFDAFRKIAVGGLQQVMAGNEKGKTIAAFSSGGCIAAMLGEVTGLQNPGKVMGFNLVMLNTAISEVLFSGNRLSLKNFNTLPHLPDNMITTM
jgi:broad specificity phosphatase PhoE